MDADRTLMTKCSIMPSSEATLSDIAMKLRATTNIAAAETSSLHVNIRHKRAATKTELAGIKLAKYGNR